MPGAQRRHRQWDDEDRRRIRQRLAEGVTMAEIAQAFGVHPETIRKLVKEMGGKAAVIREENGDAAAGTRARSHYCLDQVHRRRRGRRCLDTMT